MRNSICSVRVTVAFAVAGGADILYLSGAAASRALDVELHPAAHLRHLAGAVALRASLRASGRRLALARRANLLPLDLQPRCAAANRRPEVDIDLVFEIGSRLGALLRLAPPG